MICDFGEGLGVTDIEGQVHHCIQYERLAAEKLSAAKEEAQTKGRLYITLGVCGGAIIALLMV